jgi:tripartite-type tricarboxylate transporter receptor subunit TctC
MRLRYVLLSTALVCGSAYAQQFPLKPVRIVNAQGPGTLDALSRAYAQELTRYWGHAVIVEARAGAGSIVAADLIAKSAPDGYNILVSSSAAYTVNPWITKNMPYDPERDLAPVFGIGRTNTLIGVSSAVPAKTLQELIALAKAKPGSIAYGSAGVGSATHIQMELLLKELGGLKMLHVPYKGIADITRGLMTDEVQIGPAAIPLTLGALKAGQVKALAILGEKRDVNLPDIPTIRESGFPETSGSIIWFGFALPIRTPPAVVERYAADLRKASDEPPVKKVIDQLGWDMMLSGPKEFAELWKRERAMIGRIVQDMGFKPE